MLVYTYLLNNVTELNSRSIRKTAYVAKLLKYLTTPAVSMIVKHAQVLRGRQILSVRQQDTLRVRLRREAGVRQHGRQPQRPGAYTQTS